MTFARTYTLTQNGYRTIQKKGINLNCKRCGKPINAGDSIHSFATNHRYHPHTRPRYCHEKCYKSMLI